MSDLERDVVALIRRVSSRPIEPILDSDIMADLGLDSTAVLELVAEMEDQFDIVVPLNDLPKIRTVRDVVEYVQHSVAVRRAR